MQKAKIICIVLAVVLVSAGAVALIAEMSGNANVITPPPSDTISTSMERPSDGVFDPNDAKTNLYIAHGELLRSGGYKGVNKGTSVSLGITQTVHSYRTVVGNNVFKQSVSDGFVKMGSQVYIWGDNYIFRDVDKVSGVENVTWQNTARKVSKETYDETYGYHFAALTGYILNDETILSATLEKAENGIYTYRYVLDEKVAPYYVLYEMRTNAGTKGFATFEKAEIVVEIDENWQLQTLSTDCRYNVPMLGGVPCEEHMTEVFSDFGYNGDLPEKDFFEPYLDAEISEPIVKEPTVANRLLDMFEPYLTGNDLNVALKVSKGGSELVNAKVRATIDINNLDKITADVLVGGGLYLSYAQGKLLVDYQDFKGSVAVEDVLSLVSSVVAPSQGNEKISLDADKLLEAASFAADGSTCSVNLPLALSQDITAIVNIYGKADGESYVFTKADVQIDDISVDVELCQGFDVPEHSGEYPDVLGLLDVINGNVISVNASLGDIKADVAYDLAANKLIATAGDLTACMQNETVYVALGEVKLKVALSDLKILVSLLGDAFGNLSSALPSMPQLPQTAEEIVALISDVTATATENGVAFNLVLDGINASVELTANDGKWNLQAATVAIGNSTLTLSPSSAPVTFPQIDDEQYVDVTKLAFSYVSPITALLKAENYGAEFDVDVTVGGNTYDVIGSALFGKNGDVNVNANVSMGGKLLAKADVAYVNGALYLNVNGVKLALNTASLPQANLAKILGVLQQNDDVANVIGEITTVADKFANFDLATLDISKLVTKFSFVDQKLTVGINASEFGLGEFEVNVYATGAKLAAEVHGLELAGIALDLSAKAYASKTAVTVPDVNDYITELKVEAIGYTAYVSANLYDMSVSASVKDVFGADLDLLYQGGTVYAVYGAVKVKLNVSDIDKLLAIVSELSGGNAISMPSFNVDFNDIFNGLSAVLEGEGYSVSAIIGAITANAVFDGNAQLTKATVQVSGTEITVSTVECANVTPVNVNDEFVDVAALVDFVADDVAALIDANGYKASLQGDFTFGAEKFGVIANVNYNDGLLVDAQIYHNGVKIIVAQVRFVDDVLFADVNGIRAAVNVGGASAQSNASLQETLSKFLGYNAYVDKLINLVINVVGNFDFNSIGGLLGGLTFDGDRAVVTVNGGAFGLSMFTCGIAKGLNVSISGLRYDDVAVDVTSATVSVSDEQIARPDVNEYQTNIQIAMDEQNTVYANLDLINNVFMLRLDDLNVMYENGVIKLYFFNEQNNSAVQLKVDFANLQDIIDKFNNIAGDNAQLDGDMLSSFADIDLKAIVNSLTLSSNAETKTSTIGATFAGINAAVNFFGGETPTLQVKLPIKQLNKTFIVSADEQRVYHDYSLDNESDYVAVEDIINDYYDVLEGLVKDNKAWYFTLQATLIDNAKGITYTVNDGSFAEFVYVKGNDEHATEVSLRAKLDISKTANGKTSKIAIEAAMFDGRVYFNYNGLKISVALDAIKGCITDKPQEDFITAITNCINDIVSPEPANPNSLINRLTAVVPQIKDAIIKAMEAKDDLENLNVVRYQDIIKLFSYNRDTHDLDMVINGGIFLQDLCDEVALSVNKQNGYLHLANLSLGYGKDGNDGYNTVIDNVSALVMPKTLQQATEEITSYDAANHINLDSIKELLTAFVNTATPIEGTNHRSFHINGTVNAKVLASDLPMGLDLFVDIDEVNDVFIAVRLDRGVSEDGSTMFYQDYGGYSYLYYDGSLDKADMPEAAPFRVARDSLYNYCTKCGKYKASSVHGHYEFPVVKYYNEKRFESAVNGADGLDYDKTFTTQQFVDGILANIIDMFNFSSLIADNIKKIEISNTEVQIEKLIKNYTYADSSFNLDLDLSSMVSNSSASVKIVHDGNLELTKLGGNASIFGLVKASFDLNLVDSTYGVATEYVHARTLWK